MSRLGSDLQIGDSSMEQKSTMKLPSYSFREWYVSSSGCIRITLITLHTITCTMIIVLGLII